MLNLQIPPDVDKIDLTFEVLRSRQPIGDLYLGSLGASVLTRITDFDVRRLVNEERDVEQYLGIQRPLDKKRVNDLSKYVNYADATFPTACILAIEADYADYDEDARILTIRNYREGDDQPTKNIRYIARVLDGQHRIAGLDKFAGDMFETPVVFFIGADLAEQASIFSTVNLEQNKVGKSLAYDLYALAKTRSPQRLGHEIAVAFDRDPKSPFYQRIKRLGVATPGRYRETLSQAQFVEALIDQISREPKTDRDLLLRGRSLSLPDSDEARRFVLRIAFVQGRDLDIALSLDAYFRAVRDKWSAAWDEFGKGYVLNKTNGFRALMRLFRVVFNERYGPGNVVKFEDVQKILAKSELTDDQFTTDNYPPGTSGEGALFRALRDSCGLGED
jgi:DGQHR domain-containing protein